MYPFETYSIDDVMRIGIATVLALSVIVAVLFAIWGGFLMVISGGNEEKVKKAVNHIRYAALGILVLFLIIFMAPVLLRMLGLPYGDYFRPSVILSTVQEVGANLFGGGSFETIYDTTNTNTIPANFTDL